MFFETSLTVIALRQSRLGRPVRNWLEPSGPRLASKLGRMTFAHICDLCAVDTLITDSDADEELATAFRQAGISVEEV